MGDYLARVMTAVSQLAAAIHPATTPPSVDEAGLSALLLRVLQTTTVEAGFRVVKHASNGSAVHAALCMCCDAVGELRGARNTRLRRQELK